MTTAATATYKGKTYRLEWQGQTKYGRRAKLAFMDGSKEFWVDASLVSQASTGSTGSTLRAERTSGKRTGGKRRSSRGCPYCGASSCPRAWDPADLCQED